MLLEELKDHTKIKQWLLKSERDRNKEIGKEVMEKTLRVFSKSIKAIKKHGQMEEILKNGNIHTEDELYIWLGSGRISSKQLITWLPSIKKENKEKENIDEQLKEIESFSKKITTTARKCCR